MTDFYDYATGLAATAIPGVVQDWGMEPPQSLNEPGLPCKWLRLPRSDRERFVYAIDGADAHGSGMMTIEVVICIEAVNLGFPEPNFRNTVAMSDAVTKTLTKADVAMSWPTVSTRVTVVSVAQTDYWALVALVTARG